MAEFPPRLPGKTSAVMWARMDGVLQGLRQFRNDFFKVKDFASIMPIAEAFELQLSQNSNGDHDGTQNPQVDR